MASIKGCWGFLDNVRLLEVGRSKDGQILWLTLQDVVEALVILAGAIVVVRHLPSLCEKEFIAHRVTNWTLGDTCIRLALPVRVAYGSDLELVKRLLTELVSSHPRVLTTPAPSVFLQAFGEQALQWDISCFVARPADCPTTAHDLLLQIEQTFRQHGIPIPWPQRDLHLRSADAALIIQPLDNGYSVAVSHAHQPARGGP